MLKHPTLDKLNALRFVGMAKALSEQMNLPDIDELSFEQRLGLLVDREMTERADRRLQIRLRQAKLKQSACFDDISAVAAVAEILKIQEPSSGAIGVRVLETSRCPKSVEVLL